jgi:cytochrome b6-f complex iron-sulfur subunit
MNRRHFLESIGVGASFALTATCLQSCKHDPVAPTTTNTTNPTANSFTVDIEDPANAGLKRLGGYVIIKGIVIAKDLNGNIVAATQVCSHEGRKEVIFSKVFNEFYCTAHGARFTTAGKGTNSAGVAGLKIYKTVLEGNLVRVFL